MYSVPQRKRPRSYWNTPTSDLPRASLFEAESYFLLGPVGTLTLGRLNNNKEGLAVTHDDLQRPVRVIPENTRETPGIFGVYPGFFFCLLTAEQQ